MRVAAHLRSVHMSPQKLRIARQLLVGLSVREAEAQLMFAQGKAPRLLQKVLHSAVANAKNNFELDESHLTVADVIVGEGTRIKRLRPASKGAAHAYQRRMAHVTVVVTDKTAEHDTQSARAKKKSDIQTLSVEELAHDDVDAKRIEQVAPPGEAVDEAAAGAHTDKKMEAYQKIKAQQRGGDRKKAFRRKSV